MTHLKRTYHLMAVLLMLTGPFQAQAVAESAPEQLPAVVPAELLVGNSYFNRVLTQIEGAESSIAVMMYACVLPEDVRVSHPVRRLIDALAAADERGVEVRILLDQEVRRDGSDDLINQRAADYMKGRGLSIRRDEPDRRSHSKLIIIDNQRVIIGSANWTYSAFRRNREHSVLLHDLPIAAQCALDFDAAWQLAP